MALFGKPAAASLVPAAKNTPLFTAPYVGRDTSVGGAFKGNATNAAGTYLNKKLDNGLVVGEVEGIARNVLANAGVAAPTTSGKGELSAAIEKANLNPTFDAAVRGRAEVQGRVMSNIDKGASTTNPSAGIFRTSSSMQAERDLRNTNLLRGMDGYENEYTGHKFNYSNYLAGLDMAYAEGGATNLRTVEGSQKSEKFKVGREVADMERFGALARPKKFDWVGFLGTAALTAGVGWGASMVAGPWLAGSITPKMAATGFKLAGAAR